MRAFNSPRIAVAIILLLFQFNSVLLRSIDKDEASVVISQLDDKLSDSGAQSQEGIRRFDAEIEEAESKHDHNSEVKAADITEQLVEVNDNDSNHEKRSVKRKLDSFRESDIADENSMKKNHDQLRNVAQLIPVHIDHASPFEEENIARKFLAIEEDNEEKDGDDEEGGEVRSERSSQEEGKEQVIIQKWKQQAMALQGNLKNRTFLESLKSQNDAVLPDVPKFSEIELLNALKAIPPGKLAPSDDSYIKDIDTSMLNETELEIVKIAECLTVEPERRSFVENMFECIRGLDIINCMRILIWPIIADNFSERVMQVLPQFPLEITVSDYFPGAQEDSKKIKVSGSTSEDADAKLLLREATFCNILKEALTGQTYDDKLQSQIDPDSFGPILSPGQLEILQLAEKFLPESAREEYSSKMNSCVKRFEFFSCVKYVTWPMVKQYNSALPTFPEYQELYSSTISIYPGYPILPFPDLSDNNGQLPEVIEADALSHRTPRPETIIFQLLKTAVEDQPRSPASTIYALPEIKSINPEQLASLQMAQQLVPSPYRADFVDKTVKCIQQYNYLFCTKYSTWPTLRQWQPSLPAFPDFGSVFGNLFGFGSTFTGNVDNKKNWTEIFHNFNWGFPNLGGIMGGQSSSSGGGGGSNPGGSASGGGTGGSGGGVSTGESPGNRITDGGVITWAGIPGFKPPITISWGSAIGGGGGSPSQSGGALPAGVNIPWIGPGAGQGGQIPWVGGPGSPGIQIPSAIGSIPSVGIGGSPTIPSWGGSGDSGQGQGGSSHWPGITGGKPPINIPWGGQGSGGSAESPSQGGPSGFPSQGGPGGFPSQGSPGGFPSQTGSGGGPSQGSPGVFPSQGSPSGYPSQGGSGGIPSQGGPVGFPSQGGPGGFPSQGGSGGIPSQGGSGEVPSQGGPGGFPSQGGPGGIPSQGGPGGFPSQGGPAGFPSQGGSGGIPSQSGPGGFPSQGGSGGIPSQGGPGGFPSQGGPGGFPSQGGPGGFPSQDSSGPNQPIGGSLPSGGSGQISTGGSSSSEPSGPVGYPGLGGSGPNQPASGGSSSGGSGQSSTGGSWSSGGLGQPGLGGSAPSGGSGQSGAGGSWSSGGSGQSGSSGGSTNNEQTGVGGYPGFGGPSVGNIQTGGGNQQIPPGSSGGNFPSFPGIGSGGINIPSIQGGGLPSNQGSISWTGISGIKPPGSISWGGSGSSSGSSGSSGSSSDSNSGSNSGSSGGSSSSGSSNNNSWNNSGGSSSGQSQGGSNQSGGSNEGSGNAGYPGLPVPGIGSSEGGSSSSSSSASNQQQNSGQTGSSSNWGSSSSWNNSGSSSNWNNSGSSSSSSTSDNSASGISGGGAYPSSPYKLPQPDQLIKSPQESRPEKSLETKVIEILYNLRFSIQEVPYIPIQSSPFSESLRMFNEDQLMILTLAKSIIPPPARADIQSQTIGCMQGGSDFIGCTKNVIWPFLRFYIPQLPEFPEDNQVILLRHSSEQDFIPGVRYPLESLQIFAHPFFKQFELAGRSPLHSDISAKSDDHPIISVTDTRFTPIYSDHPDTVTLNILTTMAESTGHLDRSDYNSRVAAFRTLQATSNASINIEQENIMKIAEYLIPESGRQMFFSGMLSCLLENKFQACSRDILWPILSEHYPSLPDYPNFQEKIPENQQYEPGNRIFETDVKTGQHGDTVVTITDTRFVPIFGEHPEQMIMKMLKDIQPFSLNQIPNSISSLAKLPAFKSSFTNQQKDILVLAENLLPESLRKMFITKMSECVGENNFLDCTRDIAWPTIGQFYPRLQSFPNFGSLPSLSEAKPQEASGLLPHLEPVLPISEYRLNHLEDHQPHQVPEILDLRQFRPDVPSSPNSGNPPERLDEEYSEFPMADLGINWRKPIPEEQQQQSILLPGYTASVDTTSVVPAFPGQPTDILIDIDEDRVILPDKEGELVKKRRKREVYNLLTDDLRTSLDMQPKFNITETDLLQLLTNATKNNDEESTKESFMDSLNSTVKDSLTAEQFEILKIVEKIDKQNTRGVMANIFQCIRSLSFLRCMGIFMWPMITSAVPSLLSFAGFGGRSIEDNVEAFFGMSPENLEKNLLTRKVEIENVLINWYTSLREDKFEKTLGFITFEGYGDGEVGIRFTKPREGRAKFKDNKNMPSILTIISDIMGDVLDKPASRKSEVNKNKKGKALVHSLNEETERSNNDEGIINMFLDKLKSDTTDEDSELENRRITPEDAYQAFETLFGPRLKSRIMNKLEEFYGNKIEQDDASGEQETNGQSNEIQQEHKNPQTDDTKNENRSALTIRLPELDEELISRKNTDSIARKKNKNGMMMPGIGLAVTFILQMALAHARAAASIASMLSNMAMGSAMFSLIRQSLFGQPNHPKIKYVYDTHAVGPGITWPQG